MSKRDIKAELENNSIIGGFIAPQENPNIAPKESHTEPKKAKKGNSTKDDKKLTDAFIKGALQGADEILNGYKYKNGKNASDNYALTFKIDADLEQYLKMMGQTEAQVRNSYKEQSERQVKSRLVLDAIVKEEKLEASDKELEENPRARSAKLRVFERKI